MTPVGPARRSAEAGYALVGLMAGVAIMLIMMAVATPGWKYVMKNDREEELLFRGGEIADAIQRYQRKNGNAYPPSLDVLVKGKFLRKAYKDPMTRDGKWRFVRPGEVAAVPGPLLPGGRPPSSVPGGNPTTPGGLGGPGGMQPPGTSPTSPGQSSPTGQPMGQTVQGVASLSKDKSLRIFNGRDRYDEWLFVPGQPRVIGRAMGPAMPGIVPTSPRPGLSTPAPPVRTP